MSELNFFFLVGEVKTEWLSELPSSFRAPLHYPESRAEQEGTAAEGGAEALFKEMLCP